MKKRFIEYDLPLAEISEESAREKNIRHGHPSTMSTGSQSPVLASECDVFATVRRCLHQSTRIVIRLEPWLGLNFLTLKKPYERIIWPCRKQGEMV